MNTVNTVFAVRAVNVLRADVIIYCRTISVNRDIFSGVKVLAENIPGAMMIVNRIYSALYPIMYHKLSIAPGTVPNLSIPIKTGNGKTYRWTQFW